MARPQRNNVDYFPFYCDDGEKMFYLEQTYGNDGFAVFVKLLRELAKKDYHYLHLSDQKSKMFLASKCRVTIEVLESIITDLVQLGKFNDVLWNESKVIWCQDFVDSIQDAYTKRNNNCITFEGLLHLLDSLGIRKLSKSPIKGGKNTQSIVKDSIEEKSIYPTLDEFIAYGLDNRNVNREQLKLKYKSWVENNWKDGNNKPIKNWKTKLLNTLPHMDASNELPEFDKDKKWVRDDVWMKRTEEERNKSRMKGWMPLREYERDNSKG